MLALSVAASTGCWSSQPTPQAKKSLEKKKEEKPKPPFEPLRVFTEPNERSSWDPKDKDKQASRIVTALKPGHWTSVLVQAKANLFDFNGRLETTAEDSRHQVFELEHSPFRLSISRPAVLPKGQQKTLGTLFFAPRPTADATTGSTTGSTWIGNTLDDSGGSGARGFTDLIPHMPSYQYYLVVLARDSARYRYLKAMGSVRPPTDFLGTNVEDTAYYRVLFPELGKPLALPSEPMCWTSVGVVLWDDVLPGELTPEQQRALVDWLHWGGSVVVSGPESLDKLRGTFLAPYLPATAGASGPIDPAKLAELHSHWTVAGDDGKPLGTRAGAAWSGVALQKHPQAEFLPGTAEMVADRRVGRGRVMVTAFRLSEQDLLTWRSFDSFFNACIFRRPPRQFDASQDRFQYVGVDAPQPFAEEVATNLRILTRDAREPAAKQADKLAALVEVSAAEQAGAEVFRGDVIAQLKGESGLGGWNDFSWFSGAARQTLQDSAGISVPERTFVVKMIGLYLLVVVVANWLVFRLFGKVEWAWIAVPVIAVGWGVLVVWFAQLDIGFARAETEVAVLEMQAGYERGHVTRYSALYSSLSTSYDLRFADPSAVAQPFAVNQTKVAGQTSADVVFSTDGGARELRGFPVASNSTGMIHSEQMLALGGPIVWDPTGDDPTLENQTSLALQGAVVIRRNVDGDGSAVHETAWLGALAPGQKATVSFAAHDASKLAEARAADPLSAAEPPDGALSLRHLIACAENPRALEPGEVRLVALHDGGFGGIEVSPAAKQSRRAALVVAHLQFGDGAVPLPDANLQTRFAPSLDALLNPPAPAQPMPQPTP